MPTIAEDQYIQTQLHASKWFLQGEEASEATGEVDGVEEADGAKDSSFVGFSNKALASAVQAALTLTTHLRTQKILANDQMKRPNNSKLKPTTFHGKDSSRLHHN